jgi:5-bromo-4-chloroindolyl phosphate hydrolysis protein
MKTRKSAFSTPSQEEENRKKQYLTERENQLLKKDIEDLKKEIENLRKIIPSRSDIDKSVFRVVASILGSAGLIIAIITLLYNLLKK